MPKFIDHHSDLKLPPEAIRQLADTAKSAKHNEFGVRVLNIFHNPDGKVYCFLEAPSVEAVHKYHEVMGVDCGDVHKVDTLL